MVKFHAMNKVDFYLLTVAPSESRRFPDYAKLSIIPVCGNERADWTDICQKGKHSTQEIELIGA